MASPSLHREALATGDKGGMLPPVSVMLFLRVHVSCGTEQLRGTDIGRLQVHQTGVDQISTPKKHRVLSLRTCSLTIHLHLLTLVVLRNVLL